MPTHILVNSDNLATLGMIQSNSIVPAGNTIASTTLETTFATTALITAASLRIASIIELRMFGIFSISTLLAPTFQGKVKFGNTSPVTLFDTGILTSLVKTLPDILPWNASVYLTVQTMGATGTILGNGAVQFGTIATQPLHYLLPMTSPATVNTTIDNTLSMTGKWGGAGGSITLQQMLVKVHSNAASLLV